MSGRRSCSCSGVSIPGKLSVISYRLLVILFSFYYPGLGTNLFKRHLSPSSSHTWRIRNVGGGGPVKERMND